MSVREVRFVPAEVVQNCFTHCFKVVDDSLVASVAINDDNALQRIECDVQEQNVVYIRSRLKIY